MKKALVLFAVLFLLINSCKKEESPISNQKELPSAEVNLKLDDKVNGDYIKNPYKVGGYLIIKYSNLVYSVDGKKIIVPIFKGDKGNIEEEKIRKYLINKGETAPYVNVDDFEVNHFVALTREGEIKKTFHEFLNFYKGSLFRNINIEQPSDFGQEHYEWFITYDFEYSGIPCVMEIRIMGSEELTMRYKSVFEILPDESSKSFEYIIFLNAKSRYKK